MNDEDKKFIKDTIENAVQNKMSAYEQKTEAREKINEIKRSEQSKKDRQEYIAMLKERDQKGQATLAQKFELFKTSITDAIPDTLKEAGSTAKQFAGKSIQNGANQIGNGLGTINRKLMMSNPLTAMLYQNRELFGAVGDIGMGGLKMGWGAAKGVAGGVAGLLNAAVNHSKKSQESSENAEENTEDKKIRHFGNIFTKIDKSKQSMLGGFLEEKSDWQKQIDDLHKWYLSDHREMKKRMKVLSGGLSGLGKTMQSIKGVTDMIGNKQKLIIVGVLAGVAAIVALAAWFQDGRFAAMLKNALGIKEGKNITPSDTHKTSTQQYNKSNNDRVTEAINSIGKEKATGDVQEVKKSVSVKASDGKTYSMDTPLTSGYKIKANAGQPYRAPFDLKVIRWAKNEKNVETIDMEVERTATVTKKNAVIMNIANPLIVPGQTAKKGQIIGEVPALGEIFIKDIDKKEMQEYKKLIDNYASMGDKDKKAEQDKIKSFLNYDQTNKIANTWKALDQSVTQKENGKTFEDGKVTEKDAKNFVKGQVDAKQGFKAEADPNKINNAVMTADNRNSFQKGVGNLKAKFAGAMSDNWDRTKEQEKQLKEQEKKKKEQEKQDSKKKADAGGNKIACVPGTPTDGYTFADNGMNLSEYNASSNKTTDLSGVSA